MLVRMSKADKLKLKREALERGMTLQALGELRLLGEVRPRTRPGRPRKPRQTEELPLSQTA